MIVGAIMLIRKKNRKRDRFAGRPKKTSPSFGQKLKKIQMGKVFSAMTGQNASNAEESLDSDSTHTEELEDDTPVKEEEVDELSAQ